MQDGDFDYDGFGGGPWKFFLKWNGRRYATFEELKAEAYLYRHAVLVAAATAFAGGTRVPDDPGRECPVGIDLRLNPSSAAVDAGDVLLGFNDGFTGKAPDLGAYEVGSPLPNYGPRPEK